MGNLEGMCRGRAGQGWAGQSRVGRVEGAGCPWLGKKGTYGSAFYFCVSCPYSLSPGIPPQDRLQPLAHKEQQERSLLPSARFLLKSEQEMKSLLSLQKPVSLQLMLNGTESR